MQNTGFQFPEWKTEKDFQREIYIERDDLEGPIVMRVDEKTWTFLLQAKTTKKIEKLMLTTSQAGKITVQTKNILLEN